MKPYQILFLIVILITTSCKSQETINEISLHYNAQTRGFHLEIYLKNHILEVLKMKSTKKIELSKKQLSELNNSLSNIDFKHLKSNLSVEEAAVDRVIPATFILHYNHKKYEFRFDHNQLPVDLKKLLTGLEKLLTQEE